jgi:hypothetical protein
MLIDPLDQSVGSSADENTAIVYYIATCFWPFCSRRQQAGCCGFHTSHPLDVAAVGFLGACCTLCYLVAGDLISRAAFFALL